MRKVVTLALLAAGCGSAPNLDSLASELTRNVPASYNDPSLFGGQFVSTLLTLPRSGRSERIAWPSSYWPTYENSVAVRWNGRSEFSPAEKYDLAFNGWTPAANFASLRPFNPSDCNVSSWDRAYYDGLGPLARYVSQNMGNLRARDGVDSDSDGQIDECDDHDGVETWWGLSHAWVPSAMLEDRAERAVTYNGVTFQPSDIDALLIAAYNRAPASMIGGRCNEGNNADHPVERDEFGRPTMDDCRDTNAGALHIIMANRLGIQHRPFAADRTYDDQVWNQPVVEFEVSRLQEITVAQANTLLGVTETTYRFNSAAVKFYEVHASYTYITESQASTTAVDPSQYERREDLTYILEVNAAGSIIGGEYTGSSRDRHPDFLWDPQRLTNSSVSGLDLNIVRMLVSMSCEPQAR